MDEWIKEWIPEGPCGEEVLELLDLRLCGRIERLVKDTVSDVHRQPSIADEVVLDVLRRTVDDDATQVPAHLYLCTLTLWLI